MYYKRVVYRNRQFHVPTVLLHGRNTFHPLNEVCMGPRAGLYIVVKIKIGSLTEIQVSDYSFYVHCIIFAYSFLRVILFLRWR
jgi:hypothetical protein